MSSISSLCPLPSTPQSAVISPARSSKLAPATAGEPMFDGRQLVAHHHAHQIGAGEPDDGAPADHAALAHHGHPVAGFQDIFQAVADQNNASTTFL